MASSPASAGVWTLATESLFIWGRHDRFVPLGFIKHVERALPAAELESGHLPQTERPRETHAAIAKFLERAPQARSTRL